MSSTKPFVIAAAICLIAAAGFFSVGKKKPTKTPVEAEAPAAKAAPSQDDDIDIVVLNATSHSRREVVTGGLPIAKGAWKGGIQVMAANGDAVPSDVHVLEKWPDRSARWALVTFVAKARPGSTPFKVRLTDKTSAAKSVSTPPAWLAGVTVWLTDEHGKRQTMPLSGPFERVRIGNVSSLHRKAAKLDTLEVEVFVTTHVDGRVGLQVLLENNGPSDKFNQPGPSEEIRYFTDFGLSLPGRSEADTVELSPINQKPAVIQTRVADGSLSACLRWGWQNYPVILTGGGEPGFTFLVKGKHVPYKGRYGDPKMKSQTKGSQLKYGEDMRSYDFYRWEGGLRKEWQITLRTDKPDPATLSEQWEKPLTFVAKDRGYYAKTAALPASFVPRPDSGWKDLARRRYERWQKLKWDDSVCDPQFHNERIGLPQFIRNGGTYATSLLKNPMYGWRNFGDIVWGGGYCSLHYDYAGSMYWHFLRTGEYGAFDMAQKMVQHRRTIDHVWGVASGAPLAGLAKYEKGNYHGNFFAPSNSHTWIRSLLLDWVLTGNVVSRGAAQEYVQYQLKKDWTKWHGTYGIRIGGWALHNLAIAYKVFGDKTIRDRARMLANRCAQIEKERFNTGGYLLAGPPHRPAKAGEQGWMHCILATSIGEYILATGDKELLPLYTRMVDFHVAKILQPSREEKQADGSLKYWPMNGGGFFNGKGQVIQKNGSKGGPIPRLFFVAELQGQAAHILGRNDCADRAVQALRDAVLWFQAPQNRTMTRTAVGTWQDLSIIAYRMTMYPGSESKLHGWISLFGGYALKAMAEAEAR